MNKSLGRYVDDVDDDNNDDDGDNDVDKDDDDDGNPVSRVGKSLMSAESVYTQIKQLMT